MSTTNGEGTKPKLSSVSSPVPPKLQTTRSITEIPTGSFPMLHRPHHHHNPQHHHHHPHIHRHEKEDKTPLSGYPKLLTENLRSTADFIKSEGATPDSSRNASRRPSVLAAEAEVPAWRERRVVSEGEVQEEKEKGVLRDAELRNALMGLNTQSNDMMRRLDMTYYSVLEKVSLLQSTITSLKELATMTRQLNEDFKVESTEVIRDVEGQVNAIGGFNDQQKKIKNLEERVHAGREKIKLLASKVDVVRERAESWQRAEWEWQEKTRKRLRILWIVMSVSATLVLVLVAFQYTPNRTPGPEVTKKLNVSGLEGRELPNLDELKNETWMLKRKTQHVLLEGLRVNEREELGDEPRLRAFDEL